MSSPARTSIRRRTISGQSALETPTIMTTRKRTPSQSSNVSETEGSSRKPKNQRGTTPRRAASVSPSKAKETQEDSSLVLRSLRSRVLRSPGPKSTPLTKTPGRKKSQLELLVEENEVDVDEINGSEETKVLKGSKLKAGKVLTDSPYRTNGSAHNKEEIIVESTDEEVKFLATSPSKSPKKTLSAIVKESAAASPAKQGLERNSPLKSSKSPAKTQEQDSDEDDSSDVDLSNNKSAQSFEKSKSPASSQRATPAKSPANQSISQSKKTKSPANHSVSPSKQTTNQEVNDSSSDVTESSSENDNLNVSLKQKASASKPTLNTSISKTPNNREATPAKTPVSGATPGKTPVSGATPGKTPISGATPAKTPISGATPAKTPISGATPGKTPISGATPGKTPISGATPGKTPISGATPGKTPISGATPGKTPISGATPGKTPISGATSGKTPISRATPGKTPISGKTPKAGTTPTAKAADSSDESSSEEEENSKLVSKTANKSPFENPILSSLLLSKKNASPEKPVTKQNTTKSPAKQEDSDDWSTEDSSSEDVQNKVVSASKTPTNQKTTPGKPVSNQKPTPGKPVSNQKTTPGNPPTNQKESAKSPFNKEDSSDEDSSSDEESVAVPALQTSAKSSNSKSKVQITSAIKPTAEAIKSFKAMLAEQDSSDDDSSSDEDDLVNSAEKTKSPINVKSKTPPVNTSGLLGKALLATVPAKSPAAGVKGPVKSADDEEEDSSYDSESSDDEDDTAKVTSTKSIIPSSKTIPSKPVNKPSPKTVVAKKDGSSETEDSSDDSSDDSDAGIINKKESSTKLLELSADKKKQPVKKPLNWDDSSSTDDEFEVNMEDESSDESEEAIVVPAKKAKLSKSDNTSNGGSLFVIDKKPAAETKKPEPQQVNKKEEKQKPAAEIKKQEPQQQQVNKKEEKQKQQKNDLKRKAEDTQEDEKKSQNEPAKKKTAVSTEDGEKPEWIGDVSATIRKAIERRLRRQSRNSLLFSGYLKGMRTEEVKKLNQGVKGVKWVNYSDQARVTLKSSEAAEKLCSTLNGTTFRDNPLSAVRMIKADIPANDCVFITFSRNVDLVHIKEALPQAENVGSVPGRSYSLVKFNTAYEAEQAMKSLENKRIDGCIPMTRFSRHDPGDDKPQGKIYFK